MYILFEISLPTQLNLKQISGPPTVITDDNFVTYSASLYLMCFQTLNIILPLCDLPTLDKKKIQLNCNLLFYHLH